MFSAGSEESSCNTALRTSQRLAQDGWFFQTVNTTPDADNSQCLRLMASATRFHYELGQTKDLSKLRRVATCGGARVLKQIVVSETLSPGMRYIPDSAEPPATVSPDGRQLQWTFDFLPLTGSTLSYQVEPLRPGSHAVSEGTSISYRDTWNRVGSKTLTPARILVLGAPMQGGR